MALFEKRGKRWRVRVRRNNADISKTFTTKAEGMVWANQQELDSSGDRCPLNLNFGDLVMRYADEITHTKRSARTEFTRFESLLGRGRGKRYAICDVPLRKFDKFNLIEWREFRLKEVSRGSVARELSSLKAVCTWATNELGWFTISPGIGVTYPSSPPPRKRRVSDNEITLLCDAAKYEIGMEVSQKQHQVVIAFMLAVNSAMRSGEILSLKWINIDFEKKVAHLEMTKNGEPRDVPLNSKSISLIQLMIGIDEDKVFTITNESRDALFRKLKKKAGIKDLHFHDSRAEALTRFSKKIDVMRLARISGHKDVNILFNTYYRETAEDIAKLLD